MPKPPHLRRIIFTRLPPGIVNHLMDRIRSRKIGPEDISRLKVWMNSKPVAPDKEYWYKDFGTFKIVGEGVYPKTVLEPQMKVYGIRIAHLEMVETVLGGE